MIGNISGRRVPGILPGNVKRKRKIPQRLENETDPASGKGKASSLLTPAMVQLDLEQGVIGYRYPDNTNATGSCFQCPVEGCHSVLLNCKTFREHADLQHGLKIKKTAKNRDERSAAQKHKYQESRGKAMHKCTQLGCTAELYWPSDREHARCHKHTRFSADDARKFSVYGLERPTAAQSARGEGRIVRLMRSLVTMSKHAPHDACRGLVATRPAGHDAVLAIYEGHIGPTQRGPMTRTVETSIPKFKGKAIMGQQDPTPGRHLGQYCNSQTPGKNKVNARQIWKDELVQVGDKWELRPICYVVAIGDAFENASEDNPIEVIVTYGSAYINYYQSDDYDQNKGAEFWDEEANKAAQGALPLVQNAPSTAKRPRR